MKSLSIIMLFIVCFSNAFAQPPKKTVVKETVKTSPVVKSVSWKKNFLLNPAVFSKSSFAGKNNSELKLSIKLVHIKSADITIQVFPGVSLNEVSETFLHLYDDLIGKKPDSKGMTVEYVSNSKATLKYNDEFIKPIEFKFVYHGTKEQQAIEDSRNKDIPAEKQVNEFSTDEKNTVDRTYLIPNTPGNDKGFLMLYYTASSPEDKQKNGPKILQVLLDGISPLKLNEYNSFSVMKDVIHKIEFALPDSAKESFGQYNFSTSDGNGLISIRNIKDSSEGYSAQVEAYTPISGTVKKRGEIERHTLFNGMNIFSRLLTMKGPGEDEARSIDVYEWVNILVPDNKIIHKPLLFILNTFRMNYAESKKMNAFILNSISLPGTLTKAAISNIKDITKDEQPVGIKKK